MTRHVALGNLHENDYNDRDLGDIESFAGTIDPDAFHSSLLVRPHPELEDGEYEVVAGERRLHALRTQCDDTYGVPVVVQEMDDREALLACIQENDNRKDKSPMEQARSWAKYVEVEVDGNRMAYEEYVKELGDRGPSDYIQLPSKKNPSVKELSDRIDSSAMTVNRRLSYLLYPERLQERIKDGEGNGDFTNTAAREIAKKCASSRSGVEDPGMAIELIEHLGDRYAGGRKVGRGEESEMLDDIKEHIEYVNTYGATPDDDTDVAAALAEPEDVAANEESPDEETADTTSIEVSESAADAIEEVAATEEMSTTEVVDTITQRREHPDDSGEDHDHTPEIEFHDEAGVPAPEGVEFDEEFIENAKEIDERHEIIQSHESTIELGDLKANWDAYGHSINHIKNAKCPECGNGWEHLTWDCCGDTIKDAYVKAQKIYEDAIWDSPDTREILEESDEYDGDLPEPEGGNMTKQDVKDMMLDPATQREQERRRDEAGVNDE